MSNATPVVRQGQKAMGLGYYNSIVDEQIARLHNHKQIQLCLQKGKRMGLNTRLFVCTALAALTIMFTGCDGSDGESGINTLISTTAESAGANCADGGMRIDIGLDDDRSGTLDALEIDSTEYMCNGTDGANGLDGATGATGEDGLTALVTTTDEPAGTNCAVGGTRIDVGMDDDDNGTLEASEIDSTAYVCNGVNGLAGADGLTTLVNTTTVSAGAECTNGGIKIDVGIDDDRNGTLESIEIDNTEFVCNGVDGLTGVAGADGLTALVTTTAELPGDNCTDGGIRIDVGLDDNRSGTLDAVEIDSTSYVCNGADGFDGATGATGMTGADGLTTLINTATVSAGAECTNGGIRIEVGLDDDSNGTLDAIEIDNTEFVCNGVDGLSGADGFTSLINTTPEPEGTNCTYGGVRIDVGIDDDRNGTLDAVEIDNTEYVCNGVSTVSSTPAVQGRIAAGGAHTVVIKDDGTLWAWGANWVGQLGDGTTTDSLVPKQIGTDTNWQTIAAGDSHTVAIKNDGTLWAWGNNQGGILGDNTTTEKHSPVQIGTDTNWQSVSASYSHTVAIKNDGTLWAWGLNWAGQLGDGTTTDSLVPKKIGIDTNWQTISAGENHNLAIKSDGTLWAWGYNFRGQLGDGTTTTSLSPKQIGTDTNWQTIAAGNEHSLAIKSNGALWGWGSNLYGQLGDGTSNNIRTSPLQIGTDTNWQKVSGGNDTVAIKSNGTFWAWGINSNGQLGDGTTTWRYSPVQIGTNTDWQYVSGGNHTVAVKSDGTLWTWGANWNGELGDGTTTNSLSPILIY